MTALRSDPPHDGEALDRWRALVAGLGVTPNGSTQVMTACPVCGGKDSLSVGVGESGWPVVNCWKSSCAEAIDRNRDAWYVEARAALIGAGAPADALLPGKGQGGGRRTSAARPGPTTGKRAAAARPTEEQVAAWEAALWSNDLMRRALCKRFRVSEDVLAGTDVGYDASQDRVTFPVYEDGRLVQVIYRSLRDDLPTGVPKSRTHKGVSGSYVYAPFDLTPGRVLLCAGERDVFTAHAAGWNAVTFTGGEGSVPTRERLALLKGRDIVVVYDNDAAGRKGREKAAQAVASVATSVAVADLAPHLTDGKDISDLLAQPDGAQLLRAAVDAAMPWEGEAEEPDGAASEEYAAVLAAVRAEFLVDREAAEDHVADLLDDSGIAALPPVRYVVNGWVPIGGYTVIYGEPGVGKTFALLGMARAVRRGTRWQDNATQQGGVVYYQGEGLAQFQDRVAAWDARYPLRSDQRMAPWGTTDRVVDLTTPEGVAAVICTLRRFGRGQGEPVRLVIIDPLVEYMSGDENGDGMEAVSRGLRALAKLCDVGVVVGHHSNASGERERGTAHLRMRAGAFIRMERQDEAGTAVGLMQHKQRNAQKQALVLEMRASERSVVLEWTDALLAQDYVAQKEGAARRKRDEAKAAQESAKQDDAERKVLALLQAAGKPLSQSAIYGDVGGRREAFAALIARLEAAGRVVVERGGAGRPNWVALAVEDGGA